LDPILEHGNCFKYPALSDDVVGEEDFRFADAQEMLKVILKEKKLTAKGIYGFFQRS
jgi:5-methyltetrahydrofolate--homocysteine methyltransferase